MLYGSSPFIEQFFNQQNHQRTFNIQSYDGTIITFQTPSSLHTLEESDKKQTSHTFNQTKLTSNLYTTDRKLNQYYYQIQGVDLVIGTSRDSYTSNIPTGILKQGPQKIAIPAGKVLLYMYPGADGDGHGRGELGSVHQGVVRLTNNTSVTFSCYDHSSGAKISDRCTQILETIFNTIHLHNPLLPEFIQ